MLIRTHPSMTVLFSSHQTTLTDLMSLTPTKPASSARTDISGLQEFANFFPANFLSNSGTAVRHLYGYVADLDLLVCGPQYWFYYGVDGKPGTRFTLEVALPVQGKIPTALLPYFKRIPAFRCLSSRYQGSYEGLAEEYQQMRQYITDNGLKINGVYAESFLHIDLDEPSNNITELQIGIV